MKSYFQIEVSDLVDAAGGRDHLKANTAVRGEMKIHFAITPESTLASDEDVRGGNVVALCKARVNIHKLNAFKNHPGLVNCKNCLRLMSKATIHLVPEGK